MNRRIVFTGGGTAGHVYPGLSVIESLKMKEPGLEILWIGSSSGMEKDIIVEAGIPYAGIPSGKLRRYFSLRNFSDVFKIAAGLIKAAIILSRFRPAVVFSKGGFVSVPPVIAAGLKKIPVISHESDVTPGLATRINSRFSEAVFVSYEKSLKHVGAAKGVLTGNPVRASIFEADAAAGRRAFSAEGRRLILVIGGSQGALQINKLIEKLVPRLAEKYVVVHQTGRHDFNGPAPENYVRREYIGEELPDLMAAADLIISRAGASTLWETAALGRPTVLIPLGTGASRGDQGLNADIFSEAGASVVLEGEVGAEDLFDAIERLMGDEELRKKMSESAFQLVNGNPADIIAERILERLA